MIAYILLAAIIAIATVAALYEWRRMLDAEREYELRHTAMYVLLARELGRLNPHLRRRA